VGGVHLMPCSRHPRAAKTAAEVRIAVQTVDHTGVSLLAAGGKGGHASSARRRSDPSQVKRARPPKETDLQRAIRASLAECGQGRATTPSTTEISGNESQGRSRGSDSASEEAFEALLHIDLNDAHESRGVRCAGVDVDLDRPLCMRPFCSLFLPECEDCGLPALSSFLPACIFPCTLWRFVANRLGPSYGASASDGHQHNRASKSSRTAPASARVSARGASARTAEASGSYTSPLWKQSIGGPVAMMQRHLRLTHHLCERSPAVRK
jgi:hypothetical protein